MLGSVEARGSYGLSSVISNTSTLLKDSCGITYICLDALRLSELACIHGNSRSVDSEVCWVFNDRVY